jgi:hypothetical protein
MSVTSGPDFASGLFCMRFLPTEFDVLIVFLIMFGWEFHSLSRKADSIQETLNKILEQLKSRKN